MEIFWIKNAGIAAHEIPAQKFFSERREYLIFCRIFFRNRIGHDAPRTRDSALPKSVKNPPPSRCFCAPRGIFCRAESGFLPLAKKTPIPRAGSQHALLAFSPIFGASAIPSGGRAILHTLPKPLANKGFLLCTASATKRDLPPQTASLNAINPPLTLRNK